MPGGDQGQKTEKATPKKRRDERKKGNVFSSKDVVSVTSILSTFCIMYLMFPRIFSQISGFWFKHQYYMSSVSSLSHEFTSEIFRGAAIVLVSTVFPVMITSMMVSILASGIQTRFLFSRDALKPKFNKLNPLNGLKRMVSLKSFVEVFKGLIKISIIVAILYRFIRGKLDLISRMLQLDVTVSTVTMLQWVMELMFSICLIFVFIAALDYAYQRYEYEKQMKMSKQEIKEEYKQLEGDPHIKGKIKQIQRQMAMSRMMQSVPTADVVLKNPTHYAVALRYDIDKDGAPVVVAKGQDLTAFRIIKIAEDNDVHVIENVQLTRAIYASSEINQEVTIDLYGAVAEVLALVYKLKNKQI